MNEYVALDGRTVDEAEACDARGMLRAGYGIRRSSLFMMDSVQSDIHRHNLGDAGVGRAFGRKLFFGGQSVRPTGVPGLRDSAPAPRPVTDAAAIRALAKACRIA